MRFSLVLPILVFVSKLAIASVTIQCENLEYAGQKLEFFRPADPITGTNIFVFALNFDKQGKSETIIDCQSTTYFFTDFGIYRGMLLVEPNNTIKINLPPFREKSFADQKNPYFIPVSFWIISENKNQLNNQISAFTNQLNQLSDKYFNQLYFRQSREIYDSVLFILNQNFGKNTSESFLFYKKIKIKTIETDIFRLKPENYSEIYSDITPEFWLRQSFMELFAKTFNGLLSFEAKSVKGEELRAAVNKSDIPFLLNFIKTKYKLNGEIAELALLKMLHDAFYTGDFSKSAIQKMVSETRFTKNKNEIIRVTSVNISNKLSFLEIGNVAPVICLQTLEGEKICTNANKEKFKYLVFADIEMVICQAQLKNLSTLQERFNKYLDIFVILRKTNRDEIKKFFIENHIGGIKLIDEENQNIEKYKIKTFPQCFLLDEKHQIEFANAKAPLDGFEDQFGSFLQREFFERQRNK